MAYEYNIPGIRFDLMGKAIADAFYKKAQLDAKREQLLQTELDRQYRIYAGKVREQDFADFNSLYQTYEDAGKVFQQLNRRGGNKFKVASANFKKAKENLDLFVKDSAAWGGELKNIVALRKDAKFLVDDDLYYNYASDLNNKSTLQLKEKYESVDKAPKFNQFEWNIGNQGDVLKEITNWVKATTQIDGTSFVKKRYATDDNGNVKTKPMSVPGIETEPINVKMLKYEYGVDPNSILMQVANGGVMPKFKKFYDNTYKQFMDWSADGSNPSMQKFATDAIARAANTYKIPATNVRGEHLVALNFLDESMSGAAEVEDYNDLLNQLNARLKTWQIEGKKVDIADTFNRMKNDNSLRALTELNKILTVVGQVKATGANFIPGMEKYINKVFLEDRGIQLDQKTLENVYKQQATSVAGLREQLKGILDLLIESNSQGPGLPK